MKRMIAATITTILLSCPERIAQDLVPTKVPSTNIFYFGNKTIVVCGHKYDVGFKITPDEMAKKLDKIYKSDENYRVNITSSRAVS